MINFDELSRPLSLNRIRSITDVIHDNNKNPQYIIILYKKLN